MLGLLYALQVQPLHRPAACMRYSHFKHELASLQPVQKLKGWPALRCLNCKCWLMLPVLGAGLRPQLPDQSRGPAALWQPCPDIPHCGSHLLTGPPRPPGVVFDCADCSTHPDCCCFFASFSMILHRPVQFSIKSSQPVIVCEFCQRSLGEVLLVRLAALYKHLLPAGSTPFCQSGARQDGL